MAAESIDQARQDDLLQDGKTRLAKQLNALQKNLEQHARQRKSLGRSGVGIPGDTLVQLVDGRRVPIRQLAGQKADIWTLSNNWKINTGPCADIFSTGSHTLLEITLASGHIIRVTEQQQLFGLDRWIRAGDLKVKDRIAIARQIPEPALPLVWQGDHLLLLGHLVGDGSYLKHQPLRYTNQSEENLAAVTAAAERAFGVTVNRNEGVGNWDQLVFSGNGDRWHPAAMNKWLRDLGIFDQNSYIKHLPPEIFQLSNAQIAYLLQHAWATDGCVYEPNAEMKKDKPRIFFATCSRRLADDIEALLLRLGFVGRLHKTEQASGNPVYSVDISGADHQKRFLEEVGAFGPRSEPAKRVLALLAKIKPNTNVDTIPKAVWGHVKARMKALGITQRQMAACVAPHMVGPRISSLILRAIPWRIMLSAWMMTNCANWPNPTFSGTRLSTSRLRDRRKPTDWLYQKLQTFSPMASFVMTQLVEAAKPVRGQCTPATLGEDKVFCSFAASCFAGQFVAHCFSGGTYHEALSDYRAGTVHAW